MEQRPVALDTSGMMKTNASVSTWITIDKTYIPCSSPFSFYCWKKECLIKELFNVFAACVKGYNGINCEKRCAAPFYGLDCQYECKCAKEDCHHVDGCKQTSKTCTIAD